MQSILILLIILLSLMLYLSVVRVKENERVVIIKRGCFVEICKPGIKFFSNLNLRAIRINLPEQIPHWRSLSENELEEKIKELAKEEIFKK